MKVYVLCGENCKYEGMTKEQILTAITQAVNEGKISNIDTGFVSTIKTITGTPLKFFVGTQSEYEALTDEQKINLFAIITNDTTKEGILAAIKELKERQDTLDAWKESVMSGETEINKAETATKLTPQKNANRLESFFDKSNGFASNKTYEKTSSANILAKYLPTGICFLSISYKTTSGNYNEITTSICNIQYAISENTEYYRHWINTSWGNFVITIDNTGKVSLMIPEISEAASGGISILITPIT